MSWLLIFMKLNKIRSHINPQSGKNTCTRTRREEHKRQERHLTCTLSTCTFTPPTSPFLKAASISNMGLNLLPLQFETQLHESCPQVSPTLQMLLCSLPTWCCPPGWAPRTGAGRASSSTAWWTAGRSGQGQLSHKQPKDTASTAPTAWAA